MAEAAAVIRARRHKGEGHNGSDSDSDEDPSKARGIFRHTVNADGKKKMVRSQTLMDRKFKEYEVRMGSWTRTSVCLNFSVLHEFLLGSTSSTSSRQEGRI